MLNELLGLIKFVAIIWFGVVFLTKDMNCNKSSESYKDEIIQEYEEKKDARRGVENIADAFSYSTAALSLSGRINSAPVEKERIESGSLNPYVLLFICFVFAVSVWYFYEFLQGKREKVDEQIYYINRRLPIVEASRTPVDKEVRQRAEYHRHKLKQYGNDLVQVFEIVYGADPDHIGEPFEVFRIRVGELSKAILGGAMKTQKKENEERFWSESMRQENPEEWRNVKYK